MERDLPRVEKELQEVLSAWEEDHGRFFLVGDEHYLDTIQRQWREKSETREKEKAKRVCVFRLSSNNALSRPLLA